MPTRAPTRPSTSWRKRMLGEVPDFFDVERFSVNVERRYNALGELVTVVGGDREGRGSATSC